MRKKNEEIRNLPIGIAGIARK